MQSNKDINIVKNKKLMTQEEAIERYHKNGPVGYIKPRLKNNCTDPIGWTPK